MTEELKGLRQPPDKGQVTSGYGRRKNTLRGLGPARKNTLLGLGEPRKRRDKRHGPKLPRGFYGKKFGPKKPPKFGPKKPPKFGPKKPRKSRGVRSSRPKQRRRSTAGRRTSGRRRSAGKSWLLKKLIAVIKKAVKTKKVGDFRNRGFKNSGLGGKTGFAGMKR